MASIRSQLNVSPGKIHPNPWNPNRQSERVQEATRESIATFGFIDPVTVREHPELEGQYQIVDGEHRWRAAQSLGVKKIAVAVIDVTEAEAKKLTIILNETRGEADKIELAGLLADITDEFGDDLGDGLPYDAEELAALLALSDFDFAHFSGPVAPEPGEDDGWATIHIRVPEAVVEVWERARKHAEDHFDGDAHAMEPVRNGQALEAIIADYLAG